MKILLSEDFQKKNIHIEKKVLSNGTAFDSEETI